MLSWGIKSTHKCVMQAFGTEWPVGATSDTMGDIFIKQDTCSLLLDLSAEYFRNSMRRSSPNDALNFDVVLVNTNRRDNVCPEISWHGRPCIPATAAFANITRNGAVLATTKLKQQDIDK